MLEGYLQAMKAKKGFKYVKYGAIATAIILPILVVVGVFLVIVITSSEQSDCTTSLSAMTSKGKVTGDWQNHSSMAHQNMVQGISYLKDHEHMSGANIAAVLAIGLRESGWDPTAVNPAGSVVGIFQWGAGGVNGNRFGGTARTLEAELGLMDTELHSTHVAALIGLKTAKSIDDSAVVWDVKFEGVGIGDAQRKVADTLATATAMQKDFKLDFAGNINTDQTDPSGVGILADHANQSGSYLNDCAGGVADADGTGVVGAKGLWKPDQVPAEYQKYVHKFLSYGNAKQDWGRVGGQCFDYAVSAGQKIWSGWGNEQLSHGENADGIVQDMHNTFGSAISKTPSVGAISAVPSVHTYVVEHVFANGDIFVSEQNLSKYSGDAIGKACTFDYRIITKTQYQSSGDTFAKGPGKLTWGK